MRSLLAAATFLALLAALPARASLDDDDKAWIEDVKPLLLEEEAEILESLHAKEDRLELRRIFWARRDPNLLTPENEFEAVYRKRRAEADERFSVGPALPEITRTFTPPPRRRSGPARRAAEAAVGEEAALREERASREPMAGSLTDCGLFHIVLGAPDEVHARQRVEAGRLGAQSWVYKDKKSRLLFDETCMLPVGNEKVRRQAREYVITQPAIVPEARAGELLRRLADMMPRPSTLAALLHTPRQDFACATELYFLKEEGGTGLLGLVRGDAGTLFREEAEGGRVRLRVRAEARPVEAAAADVVASEREVVSAIEPDGGFLVSFHLGLRPGTYAVRAAVADANSDKGVVIEQRVSVPDFATGRLTIAPILALPHIEPAAGRDPRHPLEPFRMGDTRYVPRFGNVFARSESIRIVYQFYDARTDASTERPSATARVRVLGPDQMPIAEGPEDTFDTPVGGTIVGPLALAKWPPGTYTIEVRVTDRVDRKTYIRRARFEIAGDTLAAR